MQLTGDGAALFFLGTDERRGETLEVLRILCIFRSLSPEILFEPGDVDYRCERDQEADSKREPQRHPGPTLRGLVDARHLPLFLNECATVDCLQLIGDPHDGVALRHDAAVEEKPRLRLPQPAIARENVQRGGTQLLELAAEALDAFAGIRCVERRSITSQGSISRRIRALELVSIATGCRGVVVEQGVSHLYRAQESLRTDRRQQVLRSEMAFGKGRRLALHRRHALRDLKT